MKRTYIKPSLYIILLQNEDILLATSSPLPSEEDVTFDASPQTNISIWNTEIE
ncbi:MAG: hypothetical protein RR386_06705 [Bacteroidaceae bacterium]